MRYLFIFVLFALSGLGLAACNDNGQAGEIVCTSNSDCPLGNVCSGSRCVPGIDNTTDGDNEEDQQQFCGECCDDEDCGAGYYCMDNLCFKEEVPDGDEETSICTSDDDCPSGLSCVDGGCVLVTTDGDTETGETSESGETDNESKACVTNADCSDFLYCNGIEVCDQNGICQPGTPPCDDGFDCTSDSCDEELNHCENVSDHAKCDDGIACTSDVCTTANGCINTADDTACEEEELCDPDSDLADESTGCKPKPQCSTDEDCDDDLYCNGVETCVNTLCQPGEAVDCSDTIGCTADACDEETDSCTNEESNELCQDDDLCNGEEICDPDNENADENGCIEGESLICEDSVDCTDDSCVAATGCEFLPNDSLCEGELICHAEQGCINSECTVDSDCNDNDVCTGTETCELGLCVDGTPLDCEANLSGYNDSVTCNATSGCQYSCDAEYFDCNGDLGTTDNNGCETFTPTVGMGESGARTANSCALGNLNWDYYGGSCTEYYADGMEMIFKFVAPQTAEMVAAAESDDYDVDIYVLTSPCNVDDCIAYGADVGDDYTIFDAVAGNTYYIVVDGFDEDGFPVCGYFNIGVELRENTDCETTGHAHYATVIFTALLLLGWILVKRRKTVK